MNSAGLTGAAILAGASAADAPAMLSARPAPDRRRPGVVRRRDRGEAVGQKIGGAIGGGVIAYSAGGGEKIAVTTGLTGVSWPTEVVTGKIAVLGLDGEPAKP